MFNQKKQKMNKAELITSIASEAKISKADAGRALDSFITATSKALKKGDRVALVGFGTFSVAKRAARNGRNPQTGKTIKIAAKKVAKFKAGADLAKTVNK
jgi:DNA-binding protein HU-beta